MAPTPKPAAAAAAATAKPKRQIRLELYSSTSTGHQVSNGISKPTAWHRLRQSKLNQQFKCSTLPLSVLASNPVFTKASSKPQPTSSTASSKSFPTTATNPKPIFSACSVYISGTTAPLISDHTLKHVLAQHGAHVCMLLRRNSTTHVILTSVGKIGSGAGGGLAAGKLQKEIEGKKVSSIKYVSVQWVLDSIKSGKRLPERNYAEVGVGRSAGQGTLVGFVIEKENVKGEN